MKTIAQHPNNVEVYRKTNRFFLTTSMLACVTAGWLLGNLNTKILSQLNREKNNNFSYSEKNIILPSIPVNGEALPTIILSEFPVISSAK